MMKGTAVETWIKPKINRPSLSPNYLPRPHLLNELNAKRSSPLTVIVGPAGYGKTTLLVAWLGSLDWPSVWVSLDTSDNTLYSFVRYIVAAIEKHFPGVLEETSDLLQSVTLPEERVLARALINDLEQIETPFVLALDDYHLIREQAIHALVKELLRYPSSTFHLAISTRHDPPLPLSTLRAKGLVTELRIDDLRFNNEEAVGLLQRMTGMDLSVSSIAPLAEQMDGWVAGLYVAGLTLRRKPALLNMKAGMVNVASEAMAYLFDDVLLHQPPTVQTFLLRTSVLEEINPSLCEEVAGEDCAIYEGQSCLDYLVERNLFLVRTGERENVYRYHHLFQSLLRTELLRRHGEGEFEALNRRASDWHVKNDQPEEALRYALRMRDLAPAVQIIGRFRHELMNNDEWQRLEHWLSLLPRQIVETSADLTVAEGYIAYMRFRVLECAACIQRMDDLLASMPPSSEKDALMGEAAALRAWKTFQTAGDFSEMGALADKSLMLTPQNRWAARTLALVYAGGARIVKGNAKAGIDLVHETINDQYAQEPGYKLHLMVMACLMHGYVGDLSGQMRAAQEGIRIGKAVIDTGWQEKWSLHVNWS
jgi:LuxR family maltose regulon positive regulatory protein